MEKGLGGPDGEGQVGRAVGILGGTFNPVHIGHLVLAQDAVEKLELDEVRLVPCALPAHKEGRGLLDARHRVAMLELAVEGNPRMEVSKVEIERGGVSYSIDTLREFRAAEPEAEFYFIVGVDALYELHTWKDVYALLEICRLAVFHRAGVELPRREDIRLREPWPALLTEGIERGHIFEVSSSEIRRRVAEGMSISYLVPPAVEMYIYEHNLFRS